MKKIWDKIFGLNNVNKKEVINVLIWSILTTIVIIYYFLR